jgi:hypothetical protein
MNQRGFIEYLSKQYCIYFELGVVADKLNSVQLTIGDNVLRGEPNKKRCEEQVVLFTFDDYKFYLIYH